MARSYSLAHLSALALRPEELVDVAAETGCDFVGLRATPLTPDEPRHPLLGDPDAVRRVAARCAATGVRVHDLEVARLAPGTRPTDLLPLLHLAAELGCRGLVTQVPDPDLARAQDSLGTLADLAAPLGLRLDLEFVSWTEVPDLRRAATIVEGTARPGVGVLVDLLHFDRSDSDVADLRALPREWLAVAHVNDAPARRPSTVEGLVHAARHDRLVPGTGAVDVRGVVAALPEEAVLALEVPSDRLVAEHGPAGHCRRLVAATRHHLEGVTLPHEGALA